MKNYRIYIWGDRLEYIGTVKSIECVVGVLDGLNVERFMVIEHDNVRNLDDIITYKIEKLLEEKDNVSRGTKKVYTRTKL